VGQGAGQQGAADAVADGVDLVDAGLGHDLLGGVVDPLEHVVLEGLVGLAAVGIDPRGDEHREALAGQPADHRVLGAQVQDVELVDPRREDQQRDLVHRLGGRGELQQLQDVVLVDHLARGGGDVLADLELGQVGLADRQLAAAALQVGGEVLHAAHQALALALHHLAQGGGVGDQEVRRREGVGQHLGEELDPALGVGIDAFGLRDQVVQPVRRQQVALLHHVEHRVGRPVGIAEPLVALGGGDHGLGRLAGHLAGRRLPQVHVAAEQVGLGPQQAVGLGGQAGHHLVEGRADMEGIGAEGGGAVGLAQGGLGDRALGGDGGAGQVGRQRLQHLALVGRQEGVEVGQGAGDRRRSGRPAGWPIRRPGRGSPARGSAAEP
jgi:hypothetical protein